MIFRESEFVELKSEVVSDICKEVIASANKEGGTIYIGVRDDGQILGIENADRVILQINNMVRDSIKPDITMFVRYEALETDGKQIVAVTVQKGTDRPSILAVSASSPAVYMFVMVHSQTPLPILLSEK